VNISRLNTIMPAFPRMKTSSLSQFSLLKISLFEDILFWNLRFYMAVSFPTATVYFFQNYGSHILPVGTELVDLVVFKSTTSRSKGLFAAYVAAIGVSYFFDKKISLTIGLTGAVLFLIYKVITTTSFLTQKQALEPSVDFSTQKQNLAPSMQDLENRWLALTTKLVFDSYKVLNFKDPEFNTHLTALTKKLRPQTKLIRAKWENEDFLIETKEIMICCQEILFGIHTHLKQKTAGLLPSRETRLQKMVKLLNGHTKGKQVFDRAFTLLNNIYRVIRCKGYIISLPNIRNFPKGNDSSLLVTGETITAKYCDLFFTKTEEQQELKMIFNDTQDQLADLLQLVYPGSPLNAKDEQLFPGDYNSTLYIFRPEGLRIFVLGGVI
jgi:hypothetical protein